MAGRLGRASALLHRPLPRRAGGMGQLAWYPGQELASTTLPVHDAATGCRADADTFRRTRTEQRRSRHRRPLSSGSVVFTYGVGKNRGPAAARVTEARR